MTLGEGMSPLLPCPRLGRELGLEAAEFEHLRAEGVIVERWNPGGSG